MGQYIEIEQWAENLKEVTIGQWHRDEGDFIKAGDVLCEIITDKLTFEYTPEVGGTVQRIYAPENSVVPVGYCIAFIGEPGEKPDPRVEERNRQLLQRHHQKSHGDLDLDDIFAAAEQPRSRGRARAAPAARRLARENDIDIREVAEWLGDDEAMVSKQDVQDYLEEMR